MYWSLEASFWKSQNKNYWLLKLSWPIEREIDTKNVFQISKWEDTLGIQNEPLPYLKNFLIAL
jgi:hypothetical protein